MKSVLLLSLLVIPLISFAEQSKNVEVLRCRVTKMLNYTYFEEGLSPNEYPDIKISQSQTGEFSAKFGMTRAYEKSAGDVVVVEVIKHEGIRVKIKNEYGDLIFLETEYRKSMARGRVRVQEASATKASTLAYVMCDKGWL